MMEVCCDSLLVLLPFRHPNTLFLIPISASTGCYKIDGDELPCETAIEPTANHETTIEDDGKRQLLARPSCCLDFQLLPPSHQSVQALVGMSLVATGRHVKQQSSSAQNQHPLSITTESVDFLLGPLVASTSSCFHLHINQCKHWLA